jgi:hypothetical protein
VRLVLAALAGVVPLGLGGVDASGPVAGDGRVAWSENGSVYVAHEGGTAERVARGTAAGFSGRTVVYLDRGTLHVGARTIALGATDARWAGGHVLSVRPRPDGKLEVAVDGRVLDRVGGHRPRVVLGQLNARHAVWTEGVDGVFRVVVADLRTHRVARLPGPNPYRNPQFGASVTAGGTVYFGRSGTGCGGAAILRRAHGRTTQLLRLPPVLDFETSWYDAGALYLHVLNCDSLISHLEKLPLPRAWR